MSDKLTSGRSTWVCPLVSPSTTFQSSPARNLYLQQRFGLGKSEAPTNVPIKWTSAIKFFSNCKADTK